MAPNGLRAARSVPRKMCSECELPIPQRVRSASRGMARTLPFQPRAFLESWRLYRPDAS